MHTLSVSPQRIGPVGGKTSSLSTLGFVGNGSIRYGGQWGWKRSDAFLTMKRVEISPFRVKKKDEYKGKGRRFREQRGSRQWVSER